MKSLIPHPSLLRRLIAAAGIGLAVGFAFIAFFTSALHDPKANRLDVGVVGSSHVVAGVRGQLHGAVPGGFDVHRYRSVATAREAVLDQDVDGAFIPGPQPRLLEASADGANVTNVLQTAFRQATATSAQPLAPEDLAPAPAHDARGISAFFAVAGTTLGSLVFAIVLFFAGGHSVTTPLRLRFALIAGFALLSGVVMALATDTVSDGLSGHFWSVAGTLALLAAVVSLITTALVRWLGTPGVALSSLFVMLFSLPATGGAIGPEFVPDFYRSVATILPSHAALIALRGTVYFDDGGTTTALLILTAWAAGAILLQLAAHALRGEPPRPPATGSPLEQQADQPSRSLEPQPPIPAAADHGGPVRATTAFDTFAAAFAQCSADEQSDLLRSVVQRYGGQRSGSGPANRVTGLGRSVRGRMTVRRSRHRAA
jgi:hypothetical protein